MKKPIITAVLAAVMLFSGCSGVPQEEYDSLLSENVSLQSANSDAQENIGKLESDIAALQSENESLANDNSDMQSKIADLQSENDSLVKDKAEMEDKIDTLESEIEALEKSATASQQPVAESTAYEYEVKDMLAYDTFMNTALGSFTGEKMGTKWYYDGYGILVSYVEENGYDTMDSISLVNSIAFDTVTGLGDAQEASGLSLPMPLFSMWIVAKDGSVIGSGFFTLYGDNPGMSWEWKGAYEWLNNDPYQIETLEKINEIVADSD